jgi:hypothetical protein
MINRIILLIELLIHPITGNILEYYIASRSKIYIIYNVMFPKNEGPELKQNNVVYNLTLHALLFIVHV